MDSSVNPSSLPKNTLSTLRYGGYQTPASKKRPPLAHRPRASQSLQELVRALDHLNQRDATPAGVQGRKGIVHLCKGEVRGTCAKGGGTFFSSRRFGTLVRDVTRRTPGGPQRPRVPSTCQRSLADPTRQRLGVIPTLENGDRAFP